MQSRMIQRRLDGEGVCEENYVLERLFCSKEFPLVCCGIGLKLFCKLYSSGKSIITVHEHLQEMVRNHHKTDAPIGLPFHCIS